MILQRIWSVSDSQSPRQADWTFIAKSEGKFCSFRHLLLPTVRAMYNGQKNSCKGLKKKWALLQLTARFLDIVNIKLAVIFYIYWIDTMMVYGRYSDVYLYYSQKYQSIILKSKAK